MFIRIFIISLMLTIALTCSTSVPQALAWLNLATLYRVHGHSSSSLGAYQRAFLLAPSVLHIRWQTAAALVRAGKNDLALDALKPLFKNSPAEAYNLAFEALSNAGQYNELIRYYEIFSHLSDNYPNKDRKLIYLSKSSAASIVIAYIKTAKKPAVAKIKTLLSTVLALEEQSGEFQLLAEQLSQKDFWTSDMGKRVQRTVEWHSVAFEPEFRFLYSRTQPKDINLRITSLLGVNSSQFTMGDELVNNGNFEQTYALTSPLGFKPSFMSSGNPWNRATFAVGIDADYAYEGQYAIRMDGLLIENLPGLEPARAGIGIYNPITVKIDVPYVVSFSYRTQDVMNEAGAAFWISYDPKVFIANDYYLPPTQNKWRQVILIAWNRSGKDATIQPLLRLWSKGTVWFDDLSIRPLLLNTFIEPGEAIIDIHNAE